LGTPSTSNPNSIQAHGEVLFKMGFKFIFPVFFEGGAPTCSHVAKITQRLKNRVLREKFVLPIEFWFSTFFHFHFLLAVPHDVIFNVTTTI
jgi:hypothetical protein